MNISPKLLMSSGYGVNILLISLLTLNVEWINSTIAVLAWISIIFTNGSTMLFWYGATHMDRPKVRQAFLTEQNIRSSKELPFFMYFIAYLLNSLLCAMLYQYYPTTAAIFWITITLHYPVLTRLMSQVKEASSIWR